MANEDNALPTLTTFVGRHITWVLSLLPFVLVGIKLLSNSGGDIEVFRYLLQDVNIVVLLMASIVPLIPIAVFWMWVMIIEWFISTPRSQWRIPFATWLVVPLIGGLIALLFFMSTGALIGCIVLVLFLIGSRWSIRWLHRKDDVDPYENEPIRTEFLQIFMFAVMAALITAPSMWLPTEIVKVRNWNYVGYVLSTSDQWTTLLERDKTIHVFQSSDVVSRKPCSRDNWLIRPLNQIGSTKTPNTPCPG